MPPTPMIGSLVRPATISIVLAERQAEQRADELAGAVQDAALRIERAAGFGAQAAPR